MKNLFSYLEMLSAIEADLDYQNHPDKFSLGQILMGEQWLEFATAVALAEASPQTSI
jgi:hypothetical protein